MSQITTVTKCLRPINLPAVLQSLFSRHYSTESEQEIVIPKRIHRSPTDILRAISKTVNRDPTAPHYKYHDDPFLIPASSYAKRSFALAQESGRKAAKWILQEHADLFQHRVADPFIEAFAPKQIITEESDVDVESLNKAISNFAVVDAITIYKILEKKKTSLSRDQLQSLLEFVCFYNAEDRVDEDWIEERWFKQGAKDRVKPRNVWKDDDVAESIFLAIDPPDSKSYSALIIGLGTYGHLEKAWYYFNESKSKGIRLSTEVYDVLIRNVSFVKEQHEPRWALIKELLGEMHSNNILPTVRTLNSVLQALSGMAANKNSRGCALATISEFRQLGIELSLASYYHLLNLYCRDRTRTSAILMDIMNAIEGKSFSIQDPKDVFFFTTAMEICNLHLSDLNLANRVNDLLLQGDNYNLIGDSYKESTYNRNYFMLKSEYDTIDEFMKFYDLYVPNIYIPEPAVMESVLKAVDMNGASNYFPRLWSDMILFDHTTRDNLVTFIVEAMYRNPSPDDHVLTEKIADTAESIWERLLEQSSYIDVRKTNAVSWTGSMLGHLMGILLNAGRLDKASQILVKLDSEQQKIIGVPDVRVLQLYLDKCIESRDTDKALWCVQYCFDACYEDVQNMGHKVYTKLKLTEGQISKLKTLVNLDIAVESAN